MLAAAFIAVMAMFPLCCAQQPTEAPVELVRLTVQRELLASTSDTKVMFTNRKQTPHGSETKLMVETRDGMAAILTATNDNNLSSEQCRAEQSRLIRLSNDQDELKKKQRTEKADEERITRIMRALPDAFLYDSDGNEIGNPAVGRAGAQLVRLKFRPNPQYSPPSRVEQVLTAMQGYILIDPEQHRIAKIDGTLSRDVAFGWGFLGHLDKGGHFLVQQGEVIKDDWEVTRMDLSLAGKVLLFKNLSIKSDETFSDFHLAPSSLTFNQGVDLLKQQKANRCLWTGTPQM
jgi:hypothetical protein